MIEQGKGQEALLPLFSVCLALFHPREVPESQNWTPYICTKRGECLEDALSDRVGKVTVSDRL